MTVDTQLPHDESDRIAAELAALGEPGLESDELGLVDGPDVALVQGLVDVAEHVRATPDLRVLSEIEQRRAWRTVVSRLDMPAPTPAGGGRSPRGLVPALAALAAAAAVMIMPRVAPPPPGQSAELEGLSRAARSGLEALGDTTPGSRARELSSRMEGADR